jgi:hypothetical protein
MAEVPRTSSGKGASAAFCYRFSTRVGQNMGGKVGAYVVRRILQPTADAAR